jgi:tetratricopeptide (TPR) repeat protein
VALALSVVPGWGHVYWGREALGLGLFTATAVSGFALLNAFFVYLGEWRQPFIYASAALLLAAVAVAWRDIFRRTSPRRVEAEEEARIGSLKEGTVAYLRGHLEDARSLYLKCVEADPLDVDALFRLGVVCSRAGKTKEAGAWLRRARKCDFDDKWRWEISVEIERLESAKEEAPPPAERGEASTAEGPPPAPREPEKNAV